MYVTTLKFWSICSNICASDRICNPVCCFLLEISMLRKFLISLASEHIYFSCFHQLLVFMHTWDGIRSWSLWTPVSSGLGGWILGWGGEGTRKLVSDFLPPKVTEVWSASPGLRRVRVEKHVPGVMESLPLSQLLPSTSYCPTLTPPLSDLDQGLFMAVLMLDHPARFPHFPLHRPVFTCCIACVSTWHHRVHFLLSYCALGLLMPHTRLCAPWGPH